MTTATAVRRFSSVLSPSTDSSFSALRTHNYRIYLAGQSFASLGTWMQSIAQDWLVLQLTHSSTAVGITMALQFLPTLLLGVHGGMIADRFDKRRLLLVTQSTNAVLTGLLAVLTVIGLIRPEFVYAFALLSGLVFVVDGPTRQTFISEVVGGRQLRGAVSLNSAVFQTTRLVGPALAGVLIATVGSGWVFAVNAAFYAGPIIGLLRMRTAELHPAPVQLREPHALRNAARYVRSRPHIAWTIALVGVVGCFGLNFPVVLTAMASNVFHGSASTYGLFNIALAIGSVAGALIAGSRPQTRLRLIVLAAAAFGVLQTIAASAPTEVLFLVTLVVMGGANLAFQAMANASVQLWVDPAMRGRVMGLYLLVFTGGTPLGGPLIGAITNHFGARVGMAVCGIVPAIAALTVVVILWRASRVVDPSATSGRARTGATAPTRGRDVELPSDVAMPTEVAVPPGMALAAEGDALSAATSSRSRAA